MYEKVNPSHPDKIADRIAGAIVDMAYRESDNPKIAVEVLIGHGDCKIMMETSEEIPEKEIYKAVGRIAGEVPHVYIKQIPQDIHLAKNQKDTIRCGDNGIFCGLPVTEEQKNLAAFAKDLYKHVPSDGKFILADKHLIVCQSNASKKELDKFVVEKYMAASMADMYVVNPLGDWSGGTNVDTGATNRKLGSDMGDAVTGGGLHGKDLSKADVSVNIYAHMKAQSSGEPVRLFCAIGDEKVDGRPYEEIVEIAKDYITAVGGFERFAEWGLI